MNIGKHKNFLFLLPTFSVQSLVTIVQTISVTWYILSKFSEARSGLYLALYFLCYLVPQILMGPIFGVLIDSYNRKNIIIATVYTRCITMLFLALFFFLNICPLFFLFITVMVNSAMNAFSTAAANSVIPNIVKDEHLLNVNLIISLNENISYMVGAAIAGFLYLYAGMTGVFLTNGCLYLLVRVSLIFFQVSNLKTKSMQLSKQEKLISFKKIFLDLKEGLVLIKKDKPIFLIIMLGLAVNFFLFPFDSVLLPKFVKYSLQLDAAKYGLLQSIAYIGAIFGLLILTLMPKKNKLIYSIFLCALFALALNIILVGTLASSTSLKIMGSKNIYIGFCALSFIRFTFDSLLMIPIKTMYQKRIDDQLRGRFYGCMNTLWLGLQPIGSGIIGLLTSINYFSCSNLTIILGLLILIISFLAATSREIRNSYFQVNFFPNPD